MTTKKTTTDTKKAEPSNRATEVTIAERFTGFLQKNRVPLLVVTATLIVAIVALFVTIEILNTRQQEATVLAERVQRRFDAWLEASDEARPAIREEIDRMIDETVSRYSRSYGATRALFIRGRLAWESEQYEDARVAFERLADRFSRSHLAPTALFNAAVAAEAGADPDGSERILTRIVDQYGTDSIESPRALFNLGRLAEEAGRYDDAGARYNRLIEEYAGSSWTNLARNRIIFLTVNGLL